MCFQETPYSHVIALNTYLCFERCKGVGKGEVHSALAWLECRACLCSPQILIHLLVQNLKGWSRQVSLTLSGLPHKCLVELRVRSGARNISYCTKT